MNKALIVFATFFCYGNFATADISNPAFSLLKQRSYNQGVYSWATCRITQCEAGYAPAADGSRCIAPESSGELNGGQILDSVSDAQTNYTIFYTVGSINQGSADAQTNYRAASNVDVPTSIVSDSNSNYKMIIGVQK